MPLTFRHVHPRLRRYGWGKLLQGWAALLDTWCWKNPTDLPHWYGEHTLTGLLAAAAWKLGNGMSLEELGARRGSVRRHRKGRLDAYIVLRRVFYQIEAKQEWFYDVRAEAAEEAIRKFSKGLDAAARQVRDVRYEFQGHRGRVCYPPLKL